MSVVAVGLAQHGLHVRIPEPGSRYLKISDIPGASCEIAIFDNGSAGWEYRLSQGGRADADPAFIVGVVLGVLGTKPMQSMGSRSLSTRYPNLTAKSIAGRVLADHGMRARLEVVHKDEFFFEIHWEIEVTNPAQPRRGKVRIADNNSILWECHLSGATSSAAIAPQDFAATLAKVLTGSPIAPAQPAGPTAVQAAPQGPVNRVLAEGGSGQ